MSADRIVAARDRLASVCARAQLWAGELVTDTAVDLEEAVAQLEQLAARFDREVSVARVDVALATIQAHQPALA